MEQLEMRPLTREMLLYDNGDVSRQSYYMMTNGSSWRTVSKIIHDHELRFTMPKRIAWLYYDIETMRSDDLVDVPMPNQSTCHLAMLQMLIEIDGVV